MTHAYTHVCVCGIVVLCVSGCVVILVILLLGTATNTALAEQSGIRKQVSGEETQRQKQFGVSQQSLPVGELSWGWGSGITDIYGTWRTELPRSRKKSLVTWPDFTHVTGKYGGKHPVSRRCAICSNSILSSGRRVVDATLCMPHSSNGSLSTKMGPMLSVRVDQKVHFPQSLCSVMQDIQGRPLVHYTYTHILWTWASNDPSLWIQ